LPAVMRKEGIFKEGLHRGDRKTARETVGGQDKGVEERKKREAKETGGRGMIHGNGEKVGKGSGAWGLEGKALFGEVLLEKNSDTRGWSLSDEREKKKNLKKTIEGTCISHVGGKKCRPERLKKQ